MVCSLLTLLLVFAARMEGTNGFAPLFTHVPTTYATESSHLTKQWATDEFVAVAKGDEDTPTPFLSVDGNSYIDCYPDVSTKINGIQYTIGIPCDHCVALCYEEGGNFINIELDDEIMDDVFSVATNVIADEFGEELVLQRTPEVLTLAGEFEDEELAEEEDEDEEELQDGEEDVEPLIGFEHRGVEYTLVKLMDPILLVGKASPERPDVKQLLTREESERVMPTLEERFADYHKPELSE